MGMDNDTQNSHSIFVVPLTKRGMLEEAHTCQSCAPRMYQ